MNKRLHCRIVAFMAVMVLASANLTGCGGGDGSGTKVVLTTGFDKDEIFRIETSTCTLP